MLVRAYCGDVSEILDPADCLATAVDPVLKSYCVYSHVADGIGSLGVIWGGSFS